jgi:hypothetical protein
MVVVRGQEGMEQRQSISANSKSWPQPSFHLQRGPVVFFFTVLGNSPEICQILSQTLVQSFDLVVYPSEHAICFLGCSKGYCERGKVLGTYTTLGEFDGRMIVSIDLGMGSQSRRMSKCIGFETELEHTQTKKGGKCGSPCLPLNEAAHGLFITTKHLFTMYPT